MPNTVIQLKKSATPTSTPADLANGELAINFADGKLFYKNTAGFIAEFSGAVNSFGTVNANGTLVVSDTPGDILTLLAGNNITIVGDAVNDRVTIGLSNDVVVPGTFKIGTVGGDEGGEIVLGNAITNSVLAGDVKIDVYQNRLRFFESGSPNRGAFIDLSIAGSGVGSNLLATSGGTTDTTARATAEAALAKANAALPNTNGATFAGSLTVSTNLTADKIISTNNGQGENFKVGDDAWIGDFNISNAIRIKGQQDPSQAYINFGTSDGTLLGRSGSGNLTYGGNTVWHAGVDGAGSGLDADLLDGQQGSFYAAAATLSGANTAVGAGANAFASSTISGANTAVGTGANTYLLATIAGANTAVGTGANAFATAAAAGANAFMITVQNGSNTAIGAGANSFSSATIAGANTAVGAGANTYLLATLAGANTAVGAGANSFSSATIAGANTAVGTGANSFTSATIAGANTAVGAGANAFASATIAGANTAVGTGANTYLLTTLAGANAAVGTGANNYANGTFVRLTSGSQTITGDLAIVGNLTLSGNTVFIDATRLQIDDPLIYLAGNNYSSDIVDIGFIGNYVNSTGQNVHTGLFRDHETKEYYLFHSYDQEPINNHIDPTGNNLTIAVLNAAIRTSNLVLGGANLLVTLAGTNTAIGTGANAFASATIAGANTAVGTGANTVGSAAFTRANSAQTVAIAAFDKANTGGSVAVSDIAPTSAVANSLWWSSDLGKLFIYYNDGTSNQWVETSTSPPIPDTTDISNTANTARDIAILSFDRANSAQTTSVASFDSSNISSSIAISSFDRGNTAQTIAILAFNNSNTSLNVAVLSFDRGNTAQTVAIAAFDRGNTAQTVAIAAFDRGNTAQTVAIAAFDNSNTSSNVAISSFTRANSAQTIAVSAFNSANTAVTTGKAIAMAIVFG